jgi:hypothetical protein
MTIKLFIQAIAKFTLGVVLVGLLIFLPAWTFDFFGGWLLMGLLFIPMFLAGIFMMIKSPSLLESRLDVKEKEAKQEMKASNAIRTLVLFVVAMLGALLPCFHIFATLIPLFFARIAVTVRAFTDKNHSSGGESAT